MASAPTENGRTVTAMANVFYDYITVYYADLNEILRDINDCKDKIVAVTQDGCNFTIFYERRGNERDGDGNG